MGLLQITSVQLSGLVLIATGIFIRLLVGKRRFDRRGIGGMQHFSSYWMALLLTFIEWFVCGVAILLMLSGLMLLLTKYYL